MPTQSVRPSRRVPLTIFLVLAAGLVASATYLDRSLRTDARLRGAAELDSVAHLKVLAVTEYRIDLERLAESFTDSRLLRAAAAEGPGRVDPELRASAEQRLTREAARQGLQRMALLTPEGQPIIDPFPPGSAVGAAGQPLLAAAVASRRSAESQLRAEAGEGFARIEVAAPVRDGAGRVIAVVWVSRDLTAFLEELCRSWPVPNVSGEALLARRDGDAALFVTDPRGRTGWRMRMRAPLVERGRGLVRAILGERGVFEAVDFRDVPILVSARPVPGSDWIMLTRLDLREIEAPVLRVVGAVVGGLALLLMGSAIALALWYRREDRQHQALAVASRALEEGEARLRLALAGTSFVWEWDLLGGRLVADPEWGRVLGIPGAEVTGTMEEILRATVAEPDLGYVRAQFEAHLGGGAPVIEAEFRSPSGTGEVRWVSIRGRVFERDAAGRPARAIGVVADVTGRRRLQAQLERSERLLSLGTLAAGVAHEINNPLTYVLDGAGQLAADLPRLLPGRPDLAEAAVHVRDGAERVREVVRRLRAFSRPGGERRLAVDVGEEVAAAVRLAGNELRHRARLEVRGGPAPLVVAGDRQLAQVFLNLLLNAAHALEERRGSDPMVTVTVGTDGSGWARVEVRDNGQGIPPEVLPHIFEPFFTTRPQTSGTGLGLAIAWTEVEAAGGRIEVESEVGTGTVFRVLLPPAPPGAPTGARPTAAGPPPRAVPAGTHAATRPRVLVVDDDPLVGRSIARAVSRAYEVITVNGGSAGLEALASGPFAAVVCDLMMPGMTGMEFHQRVAALDPSLGSRFVFVTGGAFTEASRRFLERSSAPRVEKPFDPARLREAVDAVACGAVGEGAPAGPGVDSPAR